MINIILISGKARHGKTTTALYIKEELKKYGINAVATSYGKYIKMYAKELTDWDGQENDKPRKLLQNLGSEVIRYKLNKPDFFVKRLLEDSLVYSLYADYMIIDDARLKIEIEYFKDKFGDKVKTIHVVRPNFDNGLNSEEQHHETEVELENYSDYDYEIVNDGNLKDLKEKISKMIGGAL